MFYYTLKCVLYRPDALTSLPDDLFGPFPTINAASTLYLQNYKHAYNKTPPQRRRSSQPLHLQPKHVPPTPIHNTKSHSHHSLEGQIDFRLGPLELLSMDISHQNNKKKKRIVTEHTLQLGFGVLHLYRDIQPLTEQELPDTKIARDESLKLANQPIQTKDEDLTLCVVAVPSYMSHKDFIDFLGSANSNITQYRFIRDYSPNKYTVLLKFKTRQSAFACYQKFNGRRFNMTEPEISHVVYLHSNSIEAVQIPANSYPYLNDTLRQDLAQPQPSFAELPTCPVCLERMDESITGLLSIQCHHTTHCYCLAKWGQSLCPVCRYSHKPVLNNVSSSSSNKQQLHEHQQHQQHCFECTSTESVWICMICGHIGCGRYQEAHAYDHYMATGHLFALEIDTQRIWDYVGDGYVHRLIQNTVDGGLVELPSSSSSQPVTTKKQWTTEGSSQQQQQQQQQQPQQHQQQSRDQGKLDIMSADYSYMLTSQLDSQRMYYEEQLEALTKELANASTQVKTVVNEIEMAKTQRLALLEKGKKLDSVMMDMRREKEKAEKKLMTYREKWGELQKGLKEEKVLTKSLIRNNDLLKKDTEKNDKVLKALNDQVQGLMSFLESNNKVKEEKDTDSK